MVRQRALAGMRVGAQDEALWFFAGQPMRVGPGGYQQSVVPRCSLAAAAGGQDFDSGTTLLQPVGCQHLRDDLAPGQIGRDPGHQGLPCGVKTRQMVTQQGGAPRVGADRFKKAVAVKQPQVVNGNAGRCGRLQAAVAPDHGTGSFPGPAGLAGGHQGVGFVQGLLVFGLGIGVEDDAAACGKMEHAAGDDGRADGDGQIHRVVKTDIADAAAVQVAAARFQFVDDLHGAHLGTAGDGAARKGGLDQIHAVFVRFQFPLDPRYQVVHILIGLDALVFDHPHRAGPAHLAQVVAQQVDDH